MSRVYSVSMSTSTNMKKSEEEKNREKKIEPADDPMKRLDTEEVHIVIDEDDDDSKGSNDCPFEKQMSIRRMTSSVRDSQDTGYCSMVCGPKYRKGTLICVVLMFFNQWSGATPIVMFCPRLIE